jgi:hypothetical protein
MLDKARLNGSFHPSPDDPALPNYLCQSYNCPICLHINYRELKLEEEGHRLSNTYLLGEPAFSKRSLNRDELNYLKRDIMPTLEIMEITMTTASLATASDLEVLERWNKKLQRHNNDALEEAQEVQEQEKGREEE